MNNTITFQSFIGLDRKQSLLWSSPNINITLYNSIEAASGVNCLEFI